MKIRLTAGLALALGFLVLSAATMAHHGTANYDTEKSVSVKGTVTDFQFVNPHVLIYMQVKDNQLAGRTHQPQPAVTVRLEEGHG